MRRWAAAAAAAAAADAAVRGHVDRDLDVAHGARAGIGVGRPDGFGRLREGSERNNSTVDVSGDVDGHLRLLRRGHDNR